MYYMHVHAAIKVAYSTYIQIKNMSFFELDGTIPTQMCTEFQAIATLYWILKTSNIFMGSQAL